MATSHTAANENSLYTTPTLILGDENLEPQGSKIESKEEPALMQPEKHASGEPSFSEIMSTWESGSVDAMHKDRDAQPDGKNKPKFAKGMKPDILHLFEGPPKCTCCINWVEEYPDDIKENAEATEGARQYALLVRNRKSHQKYNADPLEIDSIVIRSPLIKAVLKKVFDSYPGVTVELENLSFKAPFAAFLHRWTILEKVVKSEPKEEVRKHVRLLCDAIGDGIKKDLKSMEDLVSHNVITFELLWTIFKPGGLFYWPKEQLLYKLIRSYMTKNAAQVPVFILVGSCVWWDNEKLGYKDEQLSVSEFEGTKAITDLDVYPIEYHPSPEDLKKRLKIRGEKFISLRGVCHKAYRGEGKEQKKYTGVIGIMEYSDPRNFNERIIIDSKTFYENYPYVKPVLHPLRNDLDATRYMDATRHMDMTGYTDTFSHFHNDNLANDDLVIDDNFHYETISSMKPKNNPINRHEDVGNEKLTDEQLMISTKWVVGFALKTKCWASFDVEKIGEIQWNNQAMENVVLPVEYKDLILGFVESQIGNGNDFGDFVEDKGRGLIFLLSGPPGVGKTFTVEATAEEQRVPIYSFSAGELGLNATHVEERLGKMLDTASKWGAVLLIDEADVFLEQRTIHDLERNRLVSVFLRMLEYFRGVLFLTSNRPSQIDEAFQSRIDIHLKYQNLDAASRRTVWKNFFSKSTKTVEVTDEELDRLAQIPLNGRQIKSIVKQSQLLAGRNNGSAVKMRTIEDILRIVNASELI